MSETFKEANDRQIAMLGRAAHLDGLKRKARAQAETAAIEALEYACTIEGNSRRGVWVKAYVEGEEWAIVDFARWLGNR
jgi:hypothetical protein